MKRLFVCTVHTSGSSRSWPERMYLVYDTVTRRCYSTPEGDLESSLGRNNAHSPIENFTKEVTEGGYVRYYQIPYYLERRFFQTITRSNHLPKVSILPNGNFEIVSDYWGYDADGETLREYDRDLNCVKREVLSEPSHVTI